MALMSDLTKSEAVQRLQRAQSAVRNIKKEAAEVAGRAVDGAIGLAGGIGSGVIRGYNPDGTPIMVPGTELPLDLALGGAMLVVGITGMGGEASRPLGALGIGLSSGGIAFATAKMVKKAREEGKL